VADSRWSSAADGLIAVQLPPPRKQMRDELRL